MSQYRLLYVVSHPIQYQAPFLRLIAQQPDISLSVVFSRDDGQKKYYDEGFKTEVAWDIPLTEGYDNTVLRDAASVIARLHGYDAVWLHGWHGRRMLRILNAAYRMGKPVLMRAENTDAAMPDGTGPRGWLKRRYLRWIFSRCDAFLPIGRDNRTYLLRHGVSSDNLFDVPYAVDNAFFQSHTDEASSRRDAFRRSLDLEEGRPVILFAGKLQNRKNPHLLLEAFQSLDPAKSNKPYLLFVGDGEMAQMLKQATESLDVRYLGFQNQSALPAFYDLADIFVLASYREPWGLAVNEAMNGRCAVIVSDQCGCATDLVSETTGRVVKAGDPEGLRSALQDLMSSPETMAQMGQAARHRITSWNYECGVEGIRNALRAVCREPRKA